MRVIDKGVGAVLLALVFVCALLVPGHASAERDAARPVTITSNKMEADNKNGVVVFSGDVVAIEDFTLCSDELTIRYGTGKEVSSMEASGRVRILLEDKTATSDKAVYDRVGRSLVLIGSATVTQCVDTVRGDRITIHLDDDNAMVESEKGGRVRAVIMPAKKCDAPAIKTGAGKDANLEETRCRRAL